MDILLANVMENVRSTTQDCYGLDPVWYFTNIFIGLRSKMYTYKILRAKCVKKSTKYIVLKNKITLEDYLESLNNFKS